MDESSMVCSMCGDIGFMEKLFQCRRCLSRFQHSYCSNYYQEEPLTNSNLCDWCLIEERRNNAGHGSISKKPVAKDHSSKQSFSERDEGASSRGKSTSSNASSGKPAGPRYKLLKDVLCRR